MPIFAIIVEHPVMAGEKTTPDIAPVGVDPISVSAVDETKGLQGTFTSITHHDRT